MKWELDGQTANVEQALAGGVAQPAGWFRFYFTDQRWEWSEQVYRMYGYEPGQVAPTTELVLSHKHPEDRGRVSATIDQIVNTPAPFSARHRIIDTGGRVRQVIAVADRLLDDQGDVIGTHGFIVDVSPVHDPAHEDIVTAKLAEISENRAGIEQAKGMLMLIYALSEEAAFDLLKWLSQEANIKLRPLAEQISADFRRTGLADRSEFDHLLLSAHRRVRAQNGGVSA